MIRHFAMMKKLHLETVQTMIRVKLVGMGKRERHNTGPLCHSVQISFPRATSYGTFLVHFNESHLYRYC